VPALNGSLTYTRFFVEGSLPEDFRERFMRAVRLRAMRPLEPDDEELERSGWAKIGEPMSTDLTYDDVFFNEYVALSFRTDSWKLPGPVLKARTREAEAAYLEKKGRERLSRSEKSELKLLVAKKLRRTMSPVTRSVDVSWSLGEGVVRFFSHATKPGGAMTELFKKTFGLVLVPESPYSLAARFTLDKGQMRAWENLEMTYLGVAGGLDRADVGAFDDAAAEEE
jgi:recombination associated protein RdgC